MSDDDRRHTGVTHPMMKLPVGLTGDDVNALTVIAQAVATFRNSGDPTDTVIELFQGASRHADTVAAFAIEGDYVCAREFAESSGRDLVLGMVALDQERTAKAVAGERS
jgi:hypothetical protein